MASRKAERLAKNQAKKIAIKKAGEKAKIGRSGLGRTASDAGARAKLITNTWEALEKADRVVWQPFATIKAEIPTGKKVIVQLATSRKVLPNRMLNFFGLDNKLYLKTIDFIKSRVKPSDVLTKNPPKGRTKGFVTFEIRKNNVAEWLEAYFKQVNGMPNAFNLTVTELMSESPHPKSPYAVARRPRFFT